MKVKVKVKIEQVLDVKYLEVAMAVRYEEEDIPNDFPFREGDLWCAKIDIDTGQILEWPKGKSGRLAMKVCDEGTYTLYDTSWKQVARLENEYVPNKLLPGEYGDYVDLIIDENGKITNWLKPPSLSNFFEDLD